jgi:hypothetical protein
MRENCPAAHNPHAVPAVLPIGDDDPAAQLVQVEPTPEYFPTAHETHADTAVLAKGEEEPAAQF